MKKKLSISLILLIAFSMLAVFSPEVKAQGTPEQLTTNPYRDSHPSWSPDGTKIAYNAFSDNWYRHIWVMNSDGSGKTQLTFGNTVDEQPVFSPDGTKIVFQRWGFRGDRFDLMLMNADGTGIIRLTDGGIPGMVEGTFQEPEWSRDGSKLLFSYGEGTTGQYKPWWICTVDFVAGDIDESLIDPLIRGFNPVFCYDDTKILFTHFIDPHFGDLRIAMMNVDGTGLDYLTDGPTDYEPDMSTLSNRIVFTRGWDVGDLYLMDADGSSQSSLLSNGYRNYMASWSPDEAYIAYASGIIGADYNIWKMEAPIWLEARGVFVRLSYDGKASGGLFTNWEEMETKENVISVIDDFVQDLVDHNINMILVGFKDDGSSGFLPLKAKKSGSAQEKPKYASGVLMYNSAKYPDFIYSHWKALIDEHGFDPMAYLVQEATSASIEVHAWVPIFKDYMASHNKPSGSMKLPLQPGTTEFVRPEDERVLDYELSIVQEILDTYPSITGINLDYIRFGDDPDPEEDGWISWIQFYIYRAVYYTSVVNAIVSFVEDVGQLAPEKILSVDTFTGSEAVLRGQDLSAISEKADVLMPMTYGLTSGSIGELVTSLKTDLDPRYIIPVIEADDDVTPSYVTESISATRENNADGFALFNYADLRLIGGLESIHIDVLQVQAGTPW